MAMDFSFGRPHMTGAELRLEDQREALADFTDRFTKQHMPDWARKPRPDGRSYPVQFASDRDWLAHTLFNVTASGRLDRRVRSCMSMATWPEGQG